MMMVVDVIPFFCSPFLKHDLTKGRCTHTHKKNDDNKIINMLPSKKKPRYQIPKYFTRKYHHYGV